MWDMAWSRQGYGHGQTPCKHTLHYCEGPRHKLYKETLNDSGDVRQLKSGPVTRPVAAAAAAAAAPRQPPPAPAGPRYNR